MAKLALVPAPTFRAPAQITVPGAEAPAEIGVEWRYKSRKDFLAWSEAVRGFAALGQFDAAVAKLGEALAAWEGPDVPYSLEALAELVDTYPAALMDIHWSYAAALFESRRKN